MPLRSIQIVTTGFIGIANVALWAGSSNVVSYIAGDQPLVFGRYSLGRFNSLMISFLISSVVIFLISGKFKHLKQRTYKVVAVFCAFIISLVTVDTLARLVVAPSYFSNQQSGLQVSDSTYKVTISDAPAAVRNYPRPSPGFPDLDCTVTMDNRGFRNLTSLTQYDVVALGDSFTEGFYVSDDHPWPVALAKRSGLAVCNLGISGAGPLMYLKTLNKFGKFLSPKIVICMLTETSEFNTAISDTRLNAFRAELATNERATHRKNVSPPDPSIVKRLNSYYHRSPIKIAFNNFCKRDLTRINLYENIEALDILSWIPVCIPVGKNAKYYNFTPNRLLSFYIPEDKFLASAGWKTAKFAI